MFKGLLLAFLIVIGLNICENAVLTIFTWRSFIQKPGELQPTFKSDVNGMEALVSLSQHDEPVIGDDKSDYLVETFIDEVIDYHTHLENELPTKYVVFYFYQTDNITVVQKTVDLLERKENEVNFPIWIRAAIDEGVDSGCQYYKVFPDAIGFTKQVMRLKHAVLGVRWTTMKYLEVDEGEYKKEHTDRMFNKLIEAGVNKKKGLPINILIRGHYANRSRENLMDLYKRLSKTNPVSFTLYADEEYMEHPKLTPQRIPVLRDAIEYFGFDKVYLQISENVRADLDLTGISNPRRTIN